MALFIQHHFLQLKRCAKGVTAIEFALIAPVLVLLVMGGLEISLMMYAQGVMEGASFTSSRTGKTGYAASGSTQTDTILAALNNRAGALLNTSNIVITSKSYTNFTNVAQPEPFVDSNGNGVRNSGESYTDSNGNGSYDTDMGISGYGSSEQVTLYTITYPWPVTTPLLRPFFGTTRTLTARTVVKNEPY